MTEKEQITQDIAGASEKTVQEGKANVFLPTSVFYNPVQEFNRDLTIAMLTLHAQEHIHILRERIEKKKMKEAAREAKLQTKSNTEDLIDSSAKEIPECKSAVQIDTSNLKCGNKCEDGLRILEGLAASGLRSVRFALEVPGVREIVTNDFDRTAVEFIKMNTKHNSVEDLITPNLGDAAMVMYQNRQHDLRFDVIDLDPYGSPAHFLDGAVQAVSEGGLLCITCTDMAILCGNAPETCHSKYGAMSLKGKFCHEMGLRIALQCIESHANRYSRYIVPLLSISADFYIRLFVRVYSGQHFVKNSVTKLSMVYMCVGCGAYSLQPVGRQHQTKGDNYKFSVPHGPPVADLCKHCSSRHVLGGPIWSAPIHDNAFLRKVIDHVIEHEDRFGTADRIIGMLTMVDEELPDVPLYHITDGLCKILHCQPPNLITVRSAIMNAGYKVSLSHAAENSLKTDAPMEVIWDILRSWVKEHPVSTKRLTDGPAKVILSVEPTIEVSFAIRDDANPQSRIKGLLRWQQNPERDWGPKARAKGGQVETLEDRRKKGVIKAKERQQAKRKADDNGANPLKRTLASVTSTETKESTTITDMDSPAMKTN